MGCSRNNHIGGEKSNLIFHFNFFHLGPNFQSFYHCKMSDADWDAEDYEPPKATAAVTPRVADRWEGEDEDDDVKDSWDKESDEEEDDFEKLQKAISEKVQSLSGSSHYNDFVEDLIKDLSLDQPATTLKKLKIHIETLHSTKLKEEKASKAKGGKKKGGTVKMDLSKDILGG